MRLVFSPTVCARRFAAVAWWGCCLGAGFAQEATTIPGLPEPVSAEHFQVLMENSPFTRSLNLSDLLILTGIATMDGKQVATLMNKETKETYVVSSEPNPQGWKMVELAGNSDIEKVAAKIAIAGGEVVTVRYNDFTVKPGEAKPASGGGGEISEGRRRGESGDRGGFRGPPPEIREKMEALPEKKRAKLFDYMMKLRMDKPDMDWDERRELFHKKLDELSK
ncbi:MAG: hypothetical protein KDN19_03385 [Verrucomicrobiae bacterium]|nr:hypothetical protein [Verrucomicrobiae bacterium]